MKVGLERAGEVLKFWWSSGINKWFTANSQFDSDINNKFSDLLSKARAGDLQHWLSSPHSALALILVVDQFPRNLYRNDARSFAYDDLALEYAKFAIHVEYDKFFPVNERIFFYMPFEHSEKLENQLIAIDLIRSTGNKENLFWAYAHMDAIVRFGRFPHRNKFLGRSTTLEEERFMNSGGFAV